MFSSPYHSQADSPKADPSRRQNRGSGMCCFILNKPSECNCRSCQFPPRLQPMSFSFACVPQLFIRWLLQEPLHKKLRRSWQEITAFYFRGANALVSTPINVAELERELCGHPDRNFVNFLLTALRYGIRVGYLGPQKARVLRNLTSASQHPEVVSANLDKEISSGGVLGPFPSSPLPNFQCHPVRVVP